MFSLNKNQKKFFSKNGYLVIENLFDKKKINKLHKLSSDIFEGKYKTKIAPDKVKQLTSTHISLSKLGISDNIKTPLQICNVWKSNYTFAQLILSKQLGRIAAELMEWNGVRLNQASLFCVPPNSGGVTMHQDDAYQDWNVPGSIITAWIPLVDVNEKRACIKYLPRSHKWREIHKPLKYFFSGKSYLYPLANNRNFNKENMISIQAKVGDVSFHHGRLWHGSGLNSTKSNRVSIANHFMPVNSKFHKTVKESILSRYKNFTNCKMDENHFPIIWTKKKRRSKFIDKFK
jgi:ectoine hydroxylase-related dioxygenase (phytanoyl-CoA dioxygenase family)